MNLFYLNFNAFSYAGTAAINLCGLTITIVSIYLFGIKTIDYVSIFRNVLMFLNSLIFLIYSTIYAFNGDPIEFDSYILYVVIPLMLYIVCLSLYPFLRFYNLLPTFARKFAYVGYPLLLGSSAFFFLSFRNNLLFGWLILLIGIVYPFYITNSALYIVIKTIRANPLSSIDNKQLTIKYISNVVFLLANVLGVTIGAIFMVPIKNIYLVAFVLTCSVGTLFDFSEFLLTINKIKKSNALVYLPNSSALS